MKDIKQLEDALLERVNGGSAPIDDPFSQAIDGFLKAAFSMDQLFKEAGGNIAKSFGEILNDVYSKLDPVEQANFLVVLEKLLFGKIATDEEEQEVEKEFMRIMSTIQK